MEPNILITLYFQILIFFWLYFYFGFPIERTPIKFFIFLLIKTEFSLNSAMTEKLIK